MCIPRVKSAPGIFLKVRTGGDRRVSPTRRWVYFARLDLCKLSPWEGCEKAITLIKIGTSIMPDTRVQSLHKAYGFPATLLACIDGGYDEERALHDRFINSMLPAAHPNGRSELFYPTRDLLDLIEEIRKNPENLP
jgi:hypothetical protein